jgi:hypothetical protein
MGDAVSCLTELLSIIFKILVFCLGGFLIIAFAGLISESCGAVVLAGIILLSIIYIYRR